MNCGLAEYNPVPLGAMLDDPYGWADAYRPMPNYGSLQILRHSAYQNYHALQALLSRQRGRFNFTASYTFSKNLGLKGADANGYRANASEYAFDPREYNYGVLGTDRTHVASLSWSLQLPDVKRGGFWQALLGNWQLAGVSSYISGAPLMGWFGMQGTTAGGVPISAAAITGSPDVYAMPVLTCDPRDDVPDGYLFNPACFTAPTARRERQRPPAVHQGPAVLRQRPVAGEELRAGQGLAAAAAHRGLQRLQPPDPLPGHDPQPDAGLRQRRADERRVRQAARRQQVRAADRPALRPVRVLTGDLWVTKTVRRARGLEALRAIRRESQESGRDRLSSRAIDAVIAKTRRARRRRTRG